MWLRIFKLCENLLVNKLHCCGYGFLGCDFICFGIFLCITWCYIPETIIVILTTIRASDSIHCWTLEQNCLFLQKKLPYFIMEVGCGTHNPSYFQIIVRIKPVQRECFPLCKWIMQSYYIFVCFLCALCIKWVLCDDFHQF